MTFKEYFLLNEFGDLTHIDSKSINTDKRDYSDSSTLDTFIKTPKGYEYYFRINDMTYKVYFYNTAIFLDRPREEGESDYDYYRSNPKIEITDRTRSYDIGLMAGNDYNLTSSGIPFIVYSNVFKAFKKFLEVAKPVAMEYYGYHRNMELLYQKFYDKFLSKDFIKINSRIYIRRRSLAQFKPDIKELIRNHMQDSLPSHQHHLDDIRKEKIDNRKELLKSRSPNLIPPEPTNNFQRRLF